MPDIRVGQVWEHHTTGRYTVYRLDTDGRVAITRGMQGGHRVWPDYLRENFRLVTDAKSDKERSDA